MAKSQPREDDIYDLGARVFAIAANMLGDVDQGMWEARGLSKGDALAAVVLGSTFLRTNSIELGLKEIIDGKMGKPIRDQHNLVALWGRLTDKWRGRVAEKVGFSEAEIREVLAEYKMASVALRYGHAFGPQGPSGSTPDMEAIAKSGEILMKLANVLGGLARPPLEAKEL